MKTTKLISNISYNTPGFLDTLFNDLVDRGVIEWAYWIHHKADMDELKDHVHFVMQPSSRVDTKDLTKLFEEWPREVFGEDFVMLDEEKRADAKPLGVTKVWRKVNSLDDWLLYAVHDAAYLSSKGQIRNIHYGFEQILATDYDALRFDWMSIDRSRYNRLAELEAAVVSRIPFPVLVQQGLIPIQQRNQFEKQYYDLKHLIDNGLSGRYQSHEEIEETKVYQIESESDQQK